MQFTVGTIVKLNGYKGDGKVREGTVEKLTPTTLTLAYPPAEPDAPPVYKSYTLEHIQV